MVFPPTPAESEWSENEDDTIDGEDVPQIRFDYNDEGRVCPYDLSLVF